MSHDNIERVVLVGANKEGSRVAGGCVYAASPAEVDWLPKVKD